MSAAPAPIPCFDPRTALQVGEVAADDPASVPARVAAARAAGKQWAARPLAERKRVVRAFGDALLARAADIAELLVAEIGRPAPEAWTSEVLTAQELFAHWLSVIDDELADVDVPLNPVNYPGKQVVIQLEPVGVVGLIMPWNYPFHLPLRTIVPGLLAGDAIVFKPSEYSPRIGALLGEVAAKVLPADLVVVLQGRGDVGAALVAARPDKVIFTGSVATGRRVAVQCAELLIPCSLELGSKDPTLVLADADLDRAVNGIVWGAFHNAGQDCSSIERCYVHRSVWQPFLDKLVAATKALRPGVDMGPLQNPTQLGKVRAQVDDALQRGAKALVGGPDGASGWDAGWGYPPTVLVDVPADALVMREETFGPVLPVFPVDSDEEAVRVANDSPYGLCASVWGKDLAHASGVVAQVECGVAFVNNCCFTGPMGGASWGGRKESGFGVTGSRFALHGLVAPRTVCIDRSRGKLEMWWYPYTDALSTMARGVIEVSRTGGARLSGAGMAVRGLLNRWKA